MMYTREKGQIGETIASKFLENKGFTVIERNYRKVWGEIDIIARKGQSFHFVEVKSITYTSPSALKYQRPEENVHNLKAKHIGRMIETYFADQGRGIEWDFHIHVLCVFMNLATRKARIKWIKDIVL